MLKVSIYGVLKNADRPGAIGVGAYALIEHKVGLYIDLWSRQGKGEGGMPSGLCPAAEGQAAAFKVESNRATSSRQCRSAPASS